MSDDDYVLSHTATASERERLDLVAGSADPGTRRRLAELGIRPGWRCLEVGAGHGSIARWMAHQVGAQGRVVATDINPRLLVDIDLPNLEVRQHDIRTDSLEVDTYDLAHSRALLMHLAEPLRAVRSMAAALGIGGWLLVEEPDFSSLRPIDSGHPRAASLNRRKEILERMMARSAVYNPYLGCRLRGLLEEAGLTEIGNEGVAHVARGGELDGRMQSVTFQTLIQLGHMSQAESVELQKVYNDPTFSYVTPTMFAAWGKRAG
ncbi:MAG TPA: methyltransferase domain-containing protein [Candidatus Binataceae bacterium]